MAFVPSDFTPPAGLTDERFVLEPLGPQHNAADYEAWSSSMEHVRATVRFSGDGWPREMTLDENRADLERHASLDGPLRERVTRWLDEDWPFQRVTY